ncbi:MAG: CAP domain-containing protein [Cyanobacteria bacterium REEB67]|nr:CAP domain-containing protein [Cyanobacteria bacterium REEB67]
MAASRGGEQSEQLLNLDQARHYMLGLINRDRAASGVEPVVLDEVANRAGNLHTDEMAQYGYLSHWTMDGRKPDQRYTECGGKDSVAENADNTDVEKPTKVALSQNQLFSKRDIDEVEGQFFNEQPPNDGHRKNIIDPDHTSVGIGMSLAGGEPNSADYPRLAITQEFINHYGTYTDIPHSINPGESFTVEGTLSRGVHVQSVDVRFEQAPQPMSIDELLKTNSYGIPGEATFNYFPPPFNSPAPINLSQVNGDEHFSLQIQTSKEWKPGIYYVCLWANVGNRKEPILISDRTVRVGGSKSRLAR